MDENQISILKELVKPDNRKIITAHNAAEFSRLDEAVYSNLTKKHESLTTLIEGMRQMTDPIEELQQKYNQIRHIKTMVALSSVSSPMNQDKGIQTGITFYNKTSPIIDTYMNYLSKAEQVYFNIARAVKDVSTQRRVDIETTVRDLKYLDEVTRLVHPKREEAESMLRTTQKTTKELSHMMKGFLKLNVGLPENKKSQLEKALPTEIALDALHEGVWNYKMNEFDRVYSTRNK